MDLDVIPISVDPPVTEGSVSTDSATSTTPSSPAAASPPPQAPPPPAQRPHLSSGGSTLTPRLYIPLDPKGSTVISYPDLLCQQFPQSAAAQAFLARKAPRPKASDDEASGKEDGTAPAPPAVKFGDDAFYEELLKRAERYEEEDSAPAKRGARVSLFEDYDLYDPFIDDSDLQTRNEEGSRLRTEGFFVYHGPLPFVDDDGAETEPIIEVEGRSAKKRKPAKKKESDKPKGKAVTADDTKGTPTAASAKAKTKDKEVDEKTPATGKPKKKRPPGDGNPDDSATKKSTKAKGKTGDTDAKKKAPAASTAVGTPGADGDTKSTKKSAPAVKRRLSSESAAATPGTAAKKAQVDPGPAATGAPPVTPLEPGPLPAPNPPSPEPERKPLRPSIFNLIDHDDDDPTRDFSPFKYHMHTNSGRNLMPPLFSERLPAKDLTDAHTFRSADNTPSKPAPHGTFENHDDLTKTYTKAAKDLTLVTEASAADTIPNVAPSPPPPTAEVAPASVLPDDTALSAQTIALRQEFEAKAHSADFSNHKKFPPSVKPVLLKLAISTLTDLGADFDDIGRVVAAYNSMTTAEGGGGTTEKEKTTTPATSNAAGGTPSRPCDLAFAIPTRDGGPPRELLSMNFYDELSQHVPYSRLTIRKIVARLTLQERIKRKEAQSEAELTKFHDLLQPCLDNLRKDPTFLRVLAEANPATPAIGAAQTGSPGFAPSPSPAPHATIPMEAVETVSKRPGGLHHLLNHPDGEPTADEEQSNVTAVDSATPASGPQATQSTPATKVSGELHLPKKETAPMTTPVSKRFTWTESIRQILWRYVQIEIELNILRSELASLEGKTLVVKEGAARRTAYLRLLNLWPEGWMTTYDISREYGTRKRKMEKFTGSG